MDDLKVLAQRLDDAFFVNGNSRLSESLHELKVLELTSGLLAEVSGLADADLLRRLAELEVTPTTASALALVPPVAAAWADGSVNDAERQAITDGRRHTLFSQSIDRDIVEAWLSEPPPPALIDAWEAFALALAGELTERQRVALSEGLLGLARTVAHAAGRILGLGGVSASEATVLKRLEGALA